MTAMTEPPAEQPPAKKKAAKKAETPELHVVTPPPKPGEKGYDWASEYPGEQCYVYTSPGGLTVGLTVMGPKRQPKPGKLHRIHRDSAGRQDMTMMWYFIELVASPNALLVMEELDPDDYNDMLRSWAEFAGIELSE